MTQQRKSIVVISSLVGGATLLTVGVVVFYQSTQSRHRHEGSLSQRANPASSHQTGTGDSVTTLIPELASVSTADLLKQLLEVSRTKPVDTHRLADIHRALVFKGESAARALLTFLLRDPAALHHVDGFYEEISRLLVELGESSTLDR